MTWATDRRLDYIDWRLSRHGSVRRGDIERTFGVSQSQASADLAAFEAAYPGAMSYDKSAKCYAPARSPYRARRGMDNQQIRTALTLLAGQGHPIGWAG